MKLRLWYNYWQPEYNNPEDAAFHDPEKFSWVKLMEAHWHLIQPELQAIVNHRDNLIQQHPNKLLYTNDGWKTKGLLTWGKTNPLLFQCPELIKVMKKIPGFVNASINILEPNSAINKHQGETNAQYRCHIGMEVPYTLPDCGLAVKDEQRSWREGKVLVFTDAQFHWGWNNTDKRRVIFLFDVMREEFLKQSFSIRLNCRALLLMMWSYSVVCHILRISDKIMLSAPKWINRGLFIFLRSLLFLAYPWQHRDKIVS